MTVKKLRAGLFLIAVVLLCAHFTGQYANAAEDTYHTNGFWCSTIGWLVHHFGYCSIYRADGMVTQQTIPSDTSTPFQTADSLGDLPPARTLQPLTQGVLTDQFSIVGNRIDRTAFDRALLSYLEQTLILMRDHMIPSKVIPSGGEFVTAEYFDARIYNLLDETNDDVRNSRGDSVTNITNNYSTTTATGDMSADTLALGTTTSRDLLTIGGGIFLDEYTPADSRYLLYNDDGDLYWNGNILSSSTAGVWTSGSGNAYRLTGNIGIGTSTPSSKLTVDGDFSAATATAALIDSGGQVCDVRAYGAVGDNSTINDGAISDAIAACGDGGTVYFPMGEFRISEPIVLDRPVTLRGAYSPRWSYSSTPRSSIRADFGSFSGVAMIHVRDRTISGEADHNNGGRIENLMLDGGSADTDVTGIYFEGLVRDWKLTDVDISQTTGNGFEAAVGTGSGNPRGFTIRGLSIYSADGHGFRATALNDSYIDDLLAVGNALRGIYLSSMGETKVANSRAVFNGLTGLYIDGSSNNGGITFTDFSTDRNDRHGVRISATGTSTVIFNGLLTRRDGPNSSGGSETPYAGVAIIGSTTAKVAPVFISGLGQTVGVDDSGNPPLSPLVGVRVTNAEYVKIDGQLWGVDDAYSDDGGNEHFIIEDDAILKTGTAGAQELYTNERKWQATSTGLFYGNGSVSIGSTTGTRLLNITGASQVGARYLDTTNNVIMDMRVEDFQGFIGTFSNHQLRFQTNNTSRLTIDTDGDIGIGTTTPSAQLTVANTVRFVNITGGTLETDALGNVAVASDERLKNIVSSFDAGLDEVLGLEPIEYRWTEESGLDTEHLYSGFSAQNVQASIPEAVGENPDGYLTLSTRPILAAVVNAIKELWQTVTGNTDKINELETRIEALEAELDIEPEDEKNELDETVPENDTEEMMDVGKTQSGPTSTTTASSSIETSEEAAASSTETSVPMQSKVEQDESDTEETRENEQLKTTEESAAAEGVQEESESSAGHFEGEKDTLDIDTEGT